MALLFCNIFMVKNRASVFHINLGSNRTSHFILVHWIFFVFSKIPSGSLLKVTSYHGNEATTCAVKLVCSLCAVCASCFFFFLHHMLTWLLVALPQPRAHYCSPLCYVSSVRPRDRVKPTFLSFRMGSGIK